MALDGVELEPVTAHTTLVQDVQDLVTQKQTYETHFSGIRIKTFVI